VQERLQKIIAAAGIASRRSAELLIQKGSVSVNGSIVRELGTKADAETDVIEVSGVPLRQPTLVTYLLNKPKGVVSSRVQQDSKAPLVTSLVPSQPPVYPVGRLDKDSEGLIILTNDGKLAQALTHPSFDHKKTYRVLVEWKEEKAEPEIKRLEELFLKGIKLSDGKVQADTISVEKKGTKRLLTLQFHIGKHHMIRRMCAVVGYRVITLERIAIASLSTNNLKTGQYRRLSQAECASLLQPS